MRTTIAILKAENLLWYSKGKIKQSIWNKAQDYINDAKYFLKNRKYFNAIAAADYAYGLLEGALLQQGYKLSEFY